MKASPRRVKSDFLIRSRIAMNPKRKIIRNQLHLQKRNTCPLPWRCEGDEHILPPLMTLLPLRIPCGIRLPLPRRPAEICTAAQHQHVHLFSKLRHETSAFPGHFFICSPSTQHGRHVHPIMLVCQRAQIPGQQICFVPRLQRHLPRMIVSGSCAG